MVDMLMAPERIVSGVDALDRAAGAIQEPGERALIVTDGVMCKLGSLDRLTNMLEANGIRYVVEDRINGEPDDGMTLHGLLVYQKENYDFLITSGGGSPTDSMKATAMLAVCDGRSADYMGKTVTRKLRPMAAAPITAGTGSEVAQFTIITDRTTQVKVLLRGLSLMPDLMVIDPAFTVTVSKGAMAATGVGTLTHAIEAYALRKTQPLSGTLALSACQWILVSLRRVWEDEQDREGRIQMPPTALEVGMAFNNASVTVAHGMNHPIGAMFHVPHGILSAMLLNVCLEYVLDRAVERLTGLAEACGLANAGDSDGEAARTFMDAVRRLLREIETPTPIEYSIVRGEFLAAVLRMTQDAAASGSPANTRKEITAEAMEELYKRFW